MKHYVRSTGFIVFSLIVYVILGETKNLTAVSKFEGLDRLHIRVRNIRLDYNNLKSFLKKTRSHRLCMEIFNSTYFNRLGITVKVHYHRYLPYWNLSNTKIIEVYNPSIEDTVAESVFVCRCETASREGAAEQKYFVSQQYNVSDTLARYVAGRFIFTRQQGTFYYEALAEEPAGIAEKNVEKLYLEAKKDYEIASSASEDPLCKLDIQRKLRICTLIMTSSYFIKNNFHFHGTLDHIYDRCRRRKIIFRTDYSIGKVNNDKIYEEWMMSCQTVKESDPNYFYLSRAYESHKLFVYSSDRSGNAMTFLEILATDVRDIIDEIVGSENRPTTSDYSNSSA